VAQAQPGSSTRSEAAPVPVIGFVGGFIRNDDFQHLEVEMLGGSRQLTATVLLRNVPAKGQL
jgi:hypothetical protein